MVLDGFWGGVSWNQDLELVGKGTPRMCWTQYWEEHRSPKNVVGSYEIRNEIRPYKNLHWGRGLLGKKDVFCIQKTGARNACFAKDLKYWRKKITLSATKSVSLLHGIDIPTTSSNLEKLPGFCLQVARKVDVFYVRSFDRLFVLWIFQGQVLPRRLEISPWQHSSGWNLGKDALWPGRHPSVRFVLWRSWWAPKNGFWEMIGPQQKCWR